MLSDVNSVKSVLHKHEWLIDSGCTVHMTPYRDIMSNYRTENVGYVSMANEKRCDVLSVGDVCMIFENGFKFTLKNVNHIPGLTHNLMSCSALEEEGLEGRRGKGIMKIMKGSLNVFKAERKKNLYICSVTYDVLAASVIHINKSDLWHKRLGHISSKGLELLHKHDFLNDKISDLSFCDDCILGKHHKVHFPTPPSQNHVTSSSILDYIHADVWGPSNVPTHGERMNRTLLNKVRCLLISPSPSKTFLGEALLTAAYLIKSLPFCFYEWQIT
ncbi:UNVERIFIED_CONTAM: Retrovirus-related Pol polyprotein from transposon TNT 1-94 [Sesamum radiatum]|uniref:Retrovirus-related Pol polyprotein from transposon TNT 1-94 n=1 Tax=Sesamum radiatum TaxID=300843 RepID=A0AAW2VNA6_SESRA